MGLNIPRTSEKRVVIAGCGFGGLVLARKLAKQNFQVVIIDKNNYHQFQPLFYQVSTAGLEPASISFPLRKIFQSNKKIHIRITEATKIESEQNRIITPIGSITYDYLVLAIGLQTNYFGMENIQKHALPMKSVTESLHLRNTILEHFEEALSAKSEEERQALMNIVVVGGGATGVEITGALAEMKKFVLPKDYPTINFDEMNIYLIEASNKLLGNMSEISSRKTHTFLTKLGATVLTETKVDDYDGNNVFLAGGSVIKSKTLIWASGVKGNSVEGLKSEVIQKGNRIKVDRINRVEGYSNIFAIGDVACMVEDKYPNGHPQVAPVAIQQGQLLAKNLKRLSENKPVKEFSYKNLGTMATVGRNLAVVELPFIKFQGFFAWMVWMFLHLMSIVGVKNRLVIFINWAWNYITYDQSLRLIFKNIDLKK